ncbi:UNVERIFIED_CONTAM: hypothetical protein FKN15_060212 [Acipenser sinensis]
MKLSLILLAVLLVLLASFCHAEVVKTFKGIQDCKAFFYKGEPPKNMATKMHKRICQCLRNNNHVNYYYATLFDPQNKIPVYSAYRLQPDEALEVRTWYYEPQASQHFNITQHNSSEKERGERRRRGEGEKRVSDPNSGEQAMQEYILGTQLQNQARQEDYAGTQYTLGHINPVSHNQELGRDATCTYTNVVPQLANFNNVIWANHERDLRDQLLQKCRNSIRYVLVGAVPSDKTFIGDGRVNVPSHIWSAYCCSNQVNGVDNGYQSEAFWADNNGANVARITVKELEKKLINSGKFDKKVNIFQGGCS